MITESFENLKMEEDETIEEFASKLSGLASAGQNLGKKFKDKKLVKKLLRSLPEKFESKKTAMATALDTDTMDFDDCVGHLQAYEMGLKNKRIVSSKGIAFAVSEEKQDIQEMKDQMRLMAKNFGRISKRLDRENRGNFGTRSQESDERPKSSRKSDVKCHECQGYGHFKADCPTAKKKGIKCDGCKGFGHNKAECVNSHPRRSKSYISESESSSEDEDSNDVAGYCAFMTTIEDDVLVGSDSDSDEEVEFDMKSEYKKLYLSWLELSEKNVSLVEENLKLQGANDRLETSLSEEKDKGRLVESELRETKKLVKMLNTGTKDLDKILSHGRTESGHRGLGYQGVTNTEKIIWVPQTQQKSVPEAEEKIWTPSKKNKGCYYCGKRGHIKRFCYRLDNKIKELTKQGRCYQNKKKTWQVWVAKSDLYSSEDVKCHVAYVPQEGRSDPMQCHQNLDHINGRSMTKLISQEQGRGVPEMENLEKVASRACNQEKHIKAQHKKVPVSVNVVFDDESLVTSSVTSNTSLLEQEMHVPTTATDVRDQNDETVNESSDEDKHGWLQWLPRVDVSWVDIVFN